MTYWQTYRPWLLKLLNQRAFLSERKYCQYLLPKAVKLKDFILYHGFRNDRQLANLILNNQELLKQIIPSNNAHEKQLQTLNTAIQEAEYYQDRS